MLNILCLACYPFGIFGKLRRHVVFHGNLYKTMERFFIHLLLTDAEVSDAMLDAKIPHEQEYKALAQFQRVVVKLVLADSAKSC